MKIYKMSKYVFDKLCSDNEITDKNVEFGNVAFISINDFGGTNEKPYFKKNHNNVLILFFDDVEEDITDKSISVKKMSNEDAKKIINFINKNRDKNFIIHCSAGISRSGTVATFINDYFNLDKEEFKKNNPYISINEHVWSVLNNAKLVYR